MLKSDFDRALAHAGRVNIQTDETFSHMGWFWLQLNDRKLMQLYNLMLAQGAEEIELNGRTGIQLSSGLVIFKKGVKA